MPALPLDDAGPYVAAAYLVFLALLLIYVGIMAYRLDGVRSQIAELAELAEQQLGDGSSSTAGAGEPGGARGDASQGAESAAAKSEGS